VAPARLAGISADLRSRLEAMALLGLKPLRESDRRELLRLHARQRGLDLPDEVVDWLIARLRRDAGTLIAALDEIDRASLSAKRRATLPFVQQVLTPLLQPLPPVLH
jgi:DnaA family protein